MWPCGRRLGRVRRWRLPLSRAQHIRSSAELEGGKVLSRLVEWFYKHDTAVLLVVLGEEHLSAVG